MKTLEQAFLERENKEIDKKRKQWEEIKIKAPDMAKDLKDLYEAFGKFNLINVRFENEQS